MVQRSVAIGQQAAHLAAAQLAGDILLGGAGGQDNLETRGIVGAGLGRHAGHGIAHHQRLAGADEQVQRAIVLLHHLQPDHAGQLLDRLFPGVDEIVGRTTGRLGTGDGVVETADALGQRIDLVGQRRQLIVDLAVLLVDLVVQGVERLGHALGLGQHGLPRRDRRRILGGGLQGGKELLHGRGDTRRAVGQQAVELGDLALEGLQFAVLAVGRTYLAGEEITGEATHVHRLGAGTDITRAIELGDVGLLNGLLPRIAGRVDVGDVVAGGGQGVLGSAQARQTNGK